MKTNGIIIFMFIIFFAYTDSGDCKPVTALPDQPVVPIVASLHTLSIHVQDSIMCDSVFQFLHTRLHLPVYYYPLAMGERKYAGIYAGNLVLEPCGPYSGNHYAAKEFRAMFFGFTFTPYQSISQAAEELANRHINHNVAEPVFIFFNDSLLCGENMTISLMNKADKVRDQARIDSLRTVLLAGSDNGPGIEYVKEIQVGYKDDPCLQKWRDLLSPFNIIFNSVMYDKGSPLLVFYKSNVKEVQGIVCKVKSLERAKHFLQENNLLGVTENNRIQVKKSAAFGLSIYFTED